MSSRKSSSGCPSATGRASSAADLRAGQLRGVGAGRRLLTGVLGAEGGQRAEGVRRLVLLGGEAAAVDGQTEDRVDVGGVVVEPVLGGDLTPLQRRLGLGVGGADDAAELLAD